jgi:hypothetical protein
MSSDVSIRGGWGAIGIELIFADDLQHAPVTGDSERPHSWSLPGMIVSSRLLVPHKIDAKCGDRFLQARLIGLISRTHRLLNMPGLAPQTLRKGLVFSGIDVLWK